MYLTSTFRYAGYHFFFPTFVNEMFGIEQRLLASGCHVFQCVNQDSDLLEASFINIDSKYFSYPFWRIFTEYTIFVELALLSSLTSVATIL